MVDTSGYVRCRYLQITTLSRAKESSCLNPTVRQRAQFVVMVIRTDFKPFHNCISYSDIRYSYACKHTTAQRRIGADKAYCYLEGGTLSVVENMQRRERYKQIKMIALKKANKDAQMEKNLGSELNHVYLLLMFSVLSTSQLVSEVRLQQDGRLVQVSLDEIMLYDLCCMYDRYSAVKERNNQACNTSSVNLAQFVTTRSRASLNEAAISKIFRIFTVFLSCQISLRQISLTILYCYKIKFSGVKHHSLKVLRQLNTEMVS